MAEIGKDIKKAKLLLESGELVAIPTETVYGLAANALSADAVARIFTAKQRPYFDPLIVHVKSANQLERYAQNIPAKAFALSAKFWPGPLTMLLPKQSIIPDIVTSGLSTVGLRCPRHPLTHDLLEVLPFPIAAPSANPFGYVSPTTAAHVADQLGDKVKYILDGGTCDVGLESTIVGFDGEAAVVFRVGGLSVEAIEKVVGKVRFELNTSSNPQAPGQLKSHYAPGKKVVLGNLEELLRRYPVDSSGILSFSTNLNAPFQFILSPAGSMEEAAKNLFSALREFDKMPVDIILAELVPNHGLGLAINDRLRRAAAVD